MRGNKEHPQIRYSLDHKLFGGWRGPLQLFTNQSFPHIRVTIGWTPVCGKQISRCVCSPPLRVSILRSSSSPSPSSTPRVRRRPLPLHPQHLALSVPPSPPLIPSHAALPQITPRACSSGNDGSARHACIDIGSTVAGIESTFADASSTPSLLHDSTPHLASAGPPPSPRYGHEHR